MCQAIENEGARAQFCDVRVGVDDGTMAFGDGVTLWRDVDFSDIQAVYIRHTAPKTIATIPGLMNPVSFAEQRASFLAAQTYSAATYAFFDHLHMSGRLVVNPLTTAYIDHNSKSQFYERLRQDGFRAPRSLTTNDAEEAGAFLDMVGEAVVKPAIGVGSTRLVSDVDRERLGELKEAPALFQERVRGSTVRIHIVGDTMVLALRILSDTIDSRTAPQGFEYLEVDPVEAEAIVRANRALGLHFAAWDAILGDDGNLTYLDCNPGPFVMWIGIENRRAVFSRLARYLVAFAETGSIIDASSRVTPVTRRESGV